MRTGDTETQQSALQSRGSAEERTATTTILFSDLVNSTELLQRAGDEHAQRIFQAHHRLLQEAVAANGGHAVKWLGDGLMVAFPSAADAVRCAVAMQQSARRPIAGEQLAIRVGLNVGDTLRDETDYFGTPVVIAKRLCDRAEAGQVLCSAVVAHLLAGRQAFTFTDCGSLALKGLDGPVAACEVVYQRDQPAALLAHPPFVGRASELAKLHAKLDEARGGRGGLVMLTGEPGIGKTRTTREFADFARQAGAAVLWGACYEGEWAPPFGPFAEAIAAYSGTTDAERLRADLGPGCAAIARLVPVLRDALPGIPEPASLQPEEERFRLLDAVSQFLIALAARAPVVLVLEDLHWADKGTIAMLRHVARFAARHPILVVGNYRDVELGRHHPLSDALGGLARETSYDRIALRGLAVEDVDRLLETIANETVPEPFVAALSRETNGNPFFIREVLLHLAEEGTIVREDGHWTARVAIEAMGIPESVRQVIGRRLARLSPNANRLLTAATAFSNVFPFAVLAAVVGGDEAGALDAIDEALEAQLVRPAGPTDTYEFTHALIRHTLYSELSPSRQVRLHRQVAEAMERLYGAGAAAHAAELAYQYARSAVLPGADRGADYALLAAERAQRACAHDELAAHLRIALDLLPETDPRRPRLSARLAMALAWTLSVDEALPLFHTAGDQIAAGEGRAAAANYLADAALALSQAGFARAASSVAKHGQTYAGERRDRTWVRLKVYEIVRREMHEPDYSGIVIDTEERREVAAVAAQCRDEFTTWEQGFLWITGFLGARSRGEALELFRTNPNDPTEATNLAGEFQPCVPLWEEWAARSEREGRIADAALYNAYLSRCLNALGEFAGARGAYERGRALAARLTVPAVPMINLAAAQEEMWRAQAERSERAIQQVQSLLEQPAIENAWALVLIRAVAAVRYGGRQRAEDALSLLAMQLPSIERAPGWAPNYTMVVCDAVSVLWQLQRTEHADVLEANVRDKVLAPDFRYPMRDGRLALAQLCALTGRDDEAVDWFARARQVLEEQGAKPLRAMVDFDEALMYQRRAGRGDTARAVECWQRAVPQFEALGMTGWVRRVEALRAV